MYFHTGFFNYAEGIPQFCVLHYKKIYLFATVMAWECSFLVAEQEKNQKKSAKGALRAKAPPLETPAASPSDTRKCTDFRVST